MATSAVSSSNRATPAVRQQADTRQAQQAAEGRRAQQAAAQQQPKPATAPAASVNTSGQTVGSQVNTTA